MENWAVPTTFGRGTHVGQYKLLHVRTRPSTMVTVFDLMSTWCGVFVLCMPCLAVHRSKCLGRCGCVCVVFKHTGMIICYFVPTSCSVLFNGRVEVCNVVGGSVCVWHFYLCVCVCVCVVCVCACACVCVCTCVCCV